MIYVLKGANRRKANKLNSFNYLLEIYKNNALEICVFCTNVSRFGLINLIQSE